MSVTSKGSSPVVKQAPKTANQQLKSVKSERDRFVAFSFAAADMLLEIKDNAGTIGYVSGAARAITGRDSKELVETGIYSLMNPADRNLLYKTITDINAGGRIRHIPVELIKPEGGVTPVFIGACRLQPNGSLYLTVVIIHSNVQGIETRSKTTGLLDVDNFAEVARTLAEDGDCKLTFIDIPELETIKNSKDTEVIEEFYAGIGAQLKHLSKNGDAAGQMTDGRFGIVHDKNLSTLQIHEQMSEMTQELDDSLSIESNAMVLDKDGLGADDIARAVLYSINQFAEKGSEDFDIVSLHDSIDELMEDTVLRVSQFKNTLEADSFNLVFQPIISLRKSSAVHHYEALSRFKEGRNTFEVINFAEATGMIQEFDLCVCQRVLDHLLRLSTSGKRPLIAVNLSAQSLESSIFISSLRKMMGEQPTLRKNILFELTESSHIKNFDLANNVLQELRRDGHLVCLDDVGAGATSFHYIRSFYVDFIKIDGSYIRKMLNSKRDLAFVRAIGDLSKAIGSSTIAEMVETQDEANALRQLGIDYGQGWLFGKPSAMFNGLENQINAHNAVRIIPDRVKLGGKLEGALEEPVAEVSKSA